MLLDYRQAPFRHFSNPTIIIADQKYKVTVGVILVGLRMALDRRKVRLVIFIRN
jgi:hypothetical protein